MFQRFLLCGLTLAAASVMAAPASAQDSRTVTLARELTGMLDRAKLDSIATRQAGDVRREMQRQRPRLNQRDTEKRQRGKRRQPVRQ